MKRAVPIAFLFLLSLAVVAWGQAESHVHDSSPGPEEPILRGETESGVFDSSSGQRAQVQGQAERAPEQGGQVPQRVPEKSIEVYGVLYGAYIHFSDSPLKEDGWSATAYAGIGYRKQHDLELGVTRSHLDYEIGDDLDQTDLTVAYTNKGILSDRIALRLGFHYIWADGDDLTDRGGIVFGKAVYFVPKKWNAGLEVTYSIYDHSDVDLRVLQLVPQAGYSLLDSESAGTLSVEGRIYIIRKNEEIGIEDTGSGRGRGRGGGGGTGENRLTTDTLFSFELTLRYGYDPFDIRLSGWAGKQVFAVKSDGFVVYNLADEYRGGLEIETGWTFGNTVRMAVAVGWSRLRHAGFEEDVDQLVVIASAGASF
jgi:hypothetical protein